MTIADRPASRPRNWDTGYELTKQERTFIMHHVYVAIAALTIGIGGWEFDSLEAATTWSDADPYAAAGVFSRVTVKPYKLVLP